MFSRHEVALALKFSDTKTLKFGNHFFIPLLVWGHIGWLGREEG